MLAEETIVELRVASGGTAPPLLLDVAYIEALPRDHLTRLEEREVVFFLQTPSFKVFNKKMLSGAITGRGEEDPLA